MANITHHSAFRPADGHIITPCPSKAHNFNVAIEHSACGRGLCFVLRSVRRATPQKVRRRMAAASTASQEARGRSSVKREEVWRSTFSIWRGVLGNDIFFMSSKSWLVRRLCEVRLSGRWEKVEATELKKCGWPQQRTSHRPGAHRRARQPRRHQRSTEKSQAATRTWLAGGGSEKDWDMSRVVCGTPISKESEGVSVGCWLELVDGVWSPCSCRCRNVQRWRRMSTQTMGVRVARK